MQSRGRRRSQDGLRVFQRFEWTLAVWFGCFFLDYLGICGGKLVEFGKWLQIISWTHVGKSGRITWRMSMWYFRIDMWFFGNSMWFSGWMDDLTHYTIWPLTFSIASPYRENSLSSTNHSLLTKSADGVLGRFFPWFLVHKGLYFWAEKRRKKRIPHYS